MNHREVRELLSARLDAELSAERAEALDVHLTTCDECRAFADGAVQLRALTAELPREEPGDLFARRREAAPRRRRPLLRLAPALAATLVVALLLITGAPPGFKVPEAAAARQLTTIRTFYAEREIKTSSPFPETERIWFRAPGFLRIEVVGDALESLAILRPGERFEGRKSGGTVTIGVPPDANVLPEPLSPTIPLLGRKVGAGATIAGRKTVRYVFDLGNGRVRTADVDPQGYEALGIKESLVLGKSESVDGATTISKRIVSFQVNVPIDDSKFSIPAGARRDEGFRSRPLSSIRLGPRPQPEGFELAEAGSGPEGSRILYARGSFPLQIDVQNRAVGFDLQTTRVDPVMVGDHPANVILDIYALPRISFGYKDRFITITGPFTPAGLVDIARTMYLR